MSEIKSVTLNNGQKMPILGLGTYLANKKGECEQAVKDAIDAGYRHIDTAYLYGNEDEVGNAVRAKIAEGVVKREDMFVVSKLGNSFHEPDLVRLGCQRSLDNLNLGPIDLYLMHTPMGYRFTKGFNKTEFRPEAGSEKVVSDTDYVETWLAMEELQREGLVRSLGVSNFNSEQLTRLLAVATIRPVTNQVECSPILTQVKLRKFCAERDIVLTAFGPLTRPHRVGVGEENSLQDKCVLSLAQKHKKTAAQIILRFMVQIGTVPIPKSSNKSRIEENFNIFDFELTEAEVHQLETLNRNHRMCPFTPDLGHKYFPFDIEF